MSNPATSRTATFEDGTTSVVYEVHDADGLAAELWIGAEHRMIMNIEVRPDRRGEGLARMVYDAAMADAEVYHVPAWGRTPEGDTFAEAVGGPVMDDETAAVITGVDLELVA